MAMVMKMYVDGDKMTTDRHDNQRAHAPTIEEWKQQGGVTLANGTSVYVMGREVYKVSRARKGDSMYCSCPAWKFQNLHPLRRTCKHCEAVCGKENEALRIAMATVCILQKKTIAAV